MLYSEEAENAVRARLLTMDGVLVWVDPLSSGKDRSRLDPLLRDIASGRVWVSTRPDVILKMGVKEVLYQTRALGWGTDTELYLSAQDFDARFPCASCCRRPSRPQAEPRERRSGRVESRSLSTALLGTPSPDTPFASCTRCAAAFRKSSHSGIS